MSKIRVLPEQLANRIAAGEVVERPSSVVKELVENSLDAGADRIEIEIEGGGTRLIRVIDNGEGMDEDDVLLCLERHGTSKLMDDKDLEEIHTLGFRGEAIPSISSVSRMSISSRPQSAVFGTTAVLNYGKLHKIHESGCAQGTIIEIKNLFGNTPARRKFLRTRRTELGHIEEIVKNYCLAAPDVSFSLRFDERQVLMLDMHQNLEQRLSQILNYSGSFIKINYPEKENSLPQLTGLLVPPDYPIKGSSKIKILVNGRSVKDRMLLHGVAEGLRGFLMKHHNPAGFLHLHLAPVDVDVNVHPTKQEVRFRRSRDIHQLIVLAIQQGMQGYQQNLKSIFRPPHSSPQAYESTNKNKPRNTPILSASFKKTGLPKDEQDSETAHNQLQVPTAPLSHTAEPIAPPVHSNFNDEPYAPSPLTYAGETKGHDLKVIGQYDKLYIFCQSSEGLVVIDQHAAQERLLFEKLKKQFLGGTIARQTLLFPETIELSLADTQKVEQYSIEIDKMGFSIREFGGNSFVISAIPALGKQIAPSELFLDVLEHFGSPSNSGRDGSLLEDILASMACKAAVKAGDTLSTPEIDALLKEMAKADLFSHCPHGRPVIKSFSTHEVRKWFHRS